MNRSTIQEETRSRARAARISGGITDVTLPWQRAPLPVPSSPSLGLRPRALGYPLSVRRWELEKAETLFRHRLFDLVRQSLIAGDHRRQSLVLRAPDWVQILPLLDDGRIVLVRQWRYGIAGPSLELPGGMVEGEGEEEAAARELREETGYRAAQWERLGEIHPNPAILDNRLSVWMATGLVRVGKPAGDEEEELVVELHPLDEIPRLIASGAIHHALVIASFHLFELSRR